MTSPATRSHEMLQAGFASVEFVIKKSLAPKDVFRHDIVDRADAANQLRLIEKLLKTGFSLR